MGSGRKNAHGIRRAIDQKIEKEGEEARLNKLSRLLVDDKARTYKME